MTIFRVIVGTTIASMALSSCGVSKLAEEDAQQQILSDPVFSNRYRDNIALIAGYRDIGLQQGFFRDDSGTNRIEIVPAAAVHIDNTRSQAIPNISGTPFEVELEIQNQDVFENTSEVDFKWRYRNLPPYLSRIAISGGTGQAVFRKSDRGWVLQQVDAVSSPEPYILTEKERTQVTEDISLEKQRRRELQAQMERCARPTKTLGTYRFASQVEYGNLRKLTINVTDVDMTYINVVGREQRIWFGDIEGVKVEPFKNEYRPKNKKDILKFAPRRPKWNTPRDVSFGTVSGPINWTPILSTATEAIANWEDRCAQLPEPSTHAMVRLRMNLQK